MDQNEPIRVEGAPGHIGAAVRRLLHPVALAIVASHLALVAFGWWSLHHLVADTVTLRLLGHVRVVHEVHRRVIDRTLEISVLLPSVFLIEYLCTGWRQSSVRHLLVDRTASGWSDVACYLFQLAPVWTLACAILSLGVVYVSGEGLRCLLADATGIDLSIAGAPLPVQVVVLFLLYTLFDYWSHRLDHSRVFWPLHRFHHAAESFSVLTAARVHPAMFTAIVGAVLPGLLLGSDPSALAYVGLVIIIIRLLIQVQFRLGRPLDRAVAAAPSPASQPQPDADQPRPAADLGPAVRHLARRAPARHAHRHPRPLPPRRLVRARPVAGLLRVLGGAEGAGRQAFRAAWARANAHSPGG